MAFLAATALLVGLAASQSAIGHDDHPKLDTWECTVAGGCVKQATRVVIDSSSHGIHQVDNPSLGCGDWGQPPNATVCPDKATCAKNCVMTGISDYTNNGVFTDADALTMYQLSPAGNLLSPRLYLLNSTENGYQMLQLTGKELSFDVDMSKLPCGMNAALYLAEMSATGGQSQYNPGGASFGTGYCDAQCYTQPFLNGEANPEGRGACCNEMDIWEANKAATAFTPHPCNQTGPYWCDKAAGECAHTGVCDQWGCGWNPYVLGNKNWYGPGLTLDTLKPFTVVTQFPANSAGELVSINRLYVQGGKIIKNAVVNVTNAPAVDKLDDTYCETTGGADRFEIMGGMKQMGEALSRGMVLIFSIWWDTGSFMTWLDSGNSGPCNATEGDPAIIQKIQPDTQVTWSNIRWGEIGSTYKAGTKCKRSM